MDKKLIPRSSELGKMDAALKRAGKLAVSGSRDVRSGRLLVDSADRNVDASSLSRNSKKR